MKITQSTVHGGGVLHDVMARDGERFRILVEPSGERILMIEDPADPDRAFIEIILQPDEADAIADLLHSAPIVDRVASLERRLTEHLDLRDKQASPPGPL